MSLTTLAQVKIALAITGTADDAYLAQIQGGVEAALERLVNRKFALTTYTEFYDGNNTNKLLLNQTPVNSVTSVKVDRSGRWGQNPEAFGTDTLLEAADYYLQMDGPGESYSESGILVRVEDVWLGYRYRPLDLLTLRVVPGQGNIRVVYVAGYSTVPLDIQMAIWQAVGMLKRAKLFGYTGFIQSESLSASSYSLGQFLQPFLLQIGTIQQIVATYTKPII